MLRPPATPSYAPRTPSHNDPLATPNRDPTMTPGRWENVWDPEAGRTPQDSGYGTDYNHTPNYQSQSPMPDGQSPFSPAGGTPGTDRSGYGYGQGTPSTPSGTPGLYTPNDATPQGSAYAAPITPSTQTPDIGTPGALDGAGSMADIGAWLYYAANAEVQVIGGPHGGQTGVVKAPPTEGENTVLVDVAGEEVHVPVADVQRVAPGKKDQIKVVKGQQAGETGVLIGIDGEDGIVKMDTNSDIKILDLESLCKVAS